MTKPSNIVRNERLKLLATTVNNVGIAIFVSGFVVPGVAFLYGTNVARPPNWPLVGLCLTVLGVALNRIANHVLGGLSE